MYVFSWRLWFSWRFWKWRNWCDLEDLDIHVRIMKRETFVFVVLSSLSWVVGNTILLKRVEVILRKLISKWCSSQNPTPTQSFRVKPLEISYQFSQFLQWQRRRSSGLWGICSYWGVRNSLVQDYLHSEEHDSPEEFKSQISDRCCAARQLSQNILST